MIDTFALVTTAAEKVMNVCGLKINNNGQHVLSRVVSTTAVQSYSPPVAPLDMDYFNYVKYFESFVQV